MKNLILLVGLLFAISSCQHEHEAEDQNTPRTVPEYTIEQFLDTENIFGGSFSPDRSKSLSQAIVRVFIMPTNLRW